MQNSITILKIDSKTKMCPRLASVPLTISYNLDFFCIFLKFGAYLHHGSVAPGQWGDFRVKNAILSVHLFFRRFLLLFFAFLSFSIFTLGYTNANFKVSLYVYFKMKIVPWKFRVLDPKNFWVIINLFYCLCMFLNKYLACFTGN